MSEFDKAKQLLREFKGDKYRFGAGVLPQVGEVVASLGGRAALVRDTFPGSDGFVQTIRDAIAGAGVTLLGEVRGAGPNAPREDLFRIRDELIALDPDVIVSFGGGSTIDATKSGEVLRTLGGSIDDYFGTGLVTAAVPSDSWNTGLPSLSGRPQLPLFDVVQGAPTMLAADKMLHSKSGCPPSSPRPMKSRYVTAKSTYGG